MDRNDIHIISRHSNWSEESIDDTLKENVYPGPKAWKKFLSILFMSLGIGFSVSGIIFFFAYNWDDLHKFAKMGLIESLIVLTTAIVLFSKLNLNIKNILLTGASALVGALMAVFGQIYQTGANAYDFFLAWTLFVSLWVVVSNFPPLWLLFLTLINTTFILYTEQVATDWSELFVMNVLFVFNSAVLVVVHLLPKIRSDIKAPAWFISILGLAAIVLSTNGIVIGIFDDYKPAFPFLLISAIVVYGVGISYGLQAKKAFYLSIIPFSIIVIIAALLIKASDEASMFFVVSLFIIGSVTGLIKGLLDLQKKWKTEPQIQTDEK